MLPVAAVAAACVCQRPKPDLPEQVRRAVGGIFQRQHRVQTAQAVDLGLAIRLHRDVRGRDARAGDLADQQRARILRRGVRLAGVELGVDAGRAPVLPWEILECEASLTARSPPKVRHG